MTASGSQSSDAIGFLTIIEKSDQGVLGGYLLLNSAGRPLEFHCTAPVKANRAQEILYGASLNSYLCGEQIARTLIEKAKTKPRFVCTNLVDVMCVRDLVSMPVVLLTDSATDTESRHRVDDQQEMADPHFNRLSRFSVRGHALAVASTARQDQQVVEQQLQEDEGSLDLAEPFDRIKEAIEEALG